MFSLGDGTKFWLYTEPTDMRKNFNMLSGIVNDHMGQNLYSGDVFVFVNSANNMMKLLRYEPGGLVIYKKRLDHGRMHLVKRVQEGDPASRPSNGVALSIPSSYNSSAFSALCGVHRKTVYTLQEIDAVETSPVMGEWSHYWIPGLPVADLAYQTNTSTRYKYGILLYLAT